MRYNMLAVRVTAEDGLQEYSCVTDSLMKLAIDIHNVLQDGGMVLYIIGEEKGGTNVNQIEP